MVPSPYVTNNHQEKNARILERHGGAKVVLEGECTGESLYEAAAAILSDIEKQKTMSDGMASLGIRDATDRLYQAVTSLL